MGNSIILIVLMRYRLVSNNLHWKINEIDEIFMIELSLMIVITIICLVQKSHLR